MGALPGAQPKRSRRQPRRAEPGLPNGERSRPKRSRGPDELQTKAAEERRVRPDERPLTTPEEEPKPRRKSPEEADPEGPTERNRRGAERRAKAAEDSRRWAEEKSKRVESERAGVGEPNVSRRSLGEPGVRPASRQRATLLGSRFALPIAGPCCHRIFVQVVKNKNPIIKEITPALLQSAFLLTPLPHISQSSSRNSFIDTR